MHRRLALLLAVPALLLAAACSDDDQQTETGDVPGSTTTVQPGGDGAGDGGGGGVTGVVTLDVHGGFVPVEVSAGNTAEVVVLENGQVISGAPTIAIYPGPALPAFQVSQADPAAVQAIVEAIEALDPDADYDQSGQMQVSDAPETTVTLHWGDDDVSISAYALGMLDDTGARAELQAVVDQINGLVTGTGETAYEPTALRVHDITDLVGERAEPVEGEPSARVLDWPIPHDATACAVLTDAAQVEAVLEVVGGATQLDWYRTDVGERRLVVVPFLPGDPGCPDS